jgi:hypothetical protein
MIVKPLMTQYATPAGSVSDDNSRYCHTDILQRYNTAINVITMHVFSFLQFNIPRFGA